jgi:hypothetical protein
MEAFILADRIVTAEHMARLDHKQFKYLKKYDLPLQRSNKTAPSMQRSQKENRNRASPPVSLKIKYLLSTITEGIDRQASLDKSLQ